MYIKTQKCVEKAKALIAESQDEDSLAFATLKLRMGVEYLFYEIRNLYSKELPPITSKWQPQRVIEEVLACDPDADKDGYVSFGNGTYTTDSTPELTFKTMAPNKKMLRKHHHRLGKYLHAPVDLNPHDHSKWLKHLNETIVALEEFQQSQALCGLRPVVSIQCTCGLNIVYSRHRVESTGQMQCLDHDCREVFDVVFTEGQIQATPRQVPYACPSCESTGTVSAGSVRQGLEVKCDFCKKTFVARGSLVLLPKDEVLNSVNQTT